MVSCVSAQQKKRPEKFFLRPEKTVIAESWYPNGTLKGGHLLSQIRTKVRHGCAMAIGTFRGLLLPVPGAKAFVVAPGSVAYYMDLIPAYTLAHIRFCPVSGALLWPFSPGIFVRHYAPPTVPPSVMGRGMWQTVTQIGNPPISALHNRFLRH